MQRYTFINIWSEGVFLGGDANTKTLQEETKVLKSTISLTLRKIKYPIMSYGKLY